MKASDFRWSRRPELPANQRAATPPWETDMTTEKMSAPGRCPVKVSEPKMPPIYSHKCDGDEMRCLDGNGCECEMAGRPPKRCDYTADQMEAHHAAWQAYAAALEVERDALKEIVESQAADVIRARDQIENAAGIRAEVLGEVREVVEAARVFTGLLQDHNDRDEQAKLRRNEQPVFGINDAIITLGDLRRLRQALATLENPNE